MQSAAMKLSHHRYYLYEVGCPKVPVILKWGFHSTCHSCVHPRALLKRSRTSLLLVDPTTSAARGGGRGSISMSIIHATTSPEAPRRIRQLQARQTVSSFCHEQCVLHVEAPSKQDAQPGSTPRTLHSVTVVHVTAGMCFWTLGSAGRNKTN